MGVKSLRVWEGNAAIEVPRRFAPNSLDSIYLQFPYSWWKRAHQKRAIIQDDFAPVLLSKVERTAAGARIPSLRSRRGPLDPRAALFCDRAARIWRPVAEAGMSAMTALSINSLARSRRRTLLISRIIDALMVVAALLFAGFVIGSNDFDWDHFLSTAEVDLRSWLVDGTPPLWSYQLCGGVTRAGDPQAFGLSPLFVVVAAFGSFWGLKLGVLLLTLLGFWAANGLLLLFYTGGRTTHNPTPVTKTIIRALSLGFVLGNYFLWHFHHGHLTFGLDFVALGLVRCLLEAYFGPTPKYYPLLAVLSGWAYFSAGFYGSLIFFLFPLTVGLVLALATVLGIPSLRQSAPEGGLRRLSRMVGFGVLGLGLGAYKIYYVAAFQQAHPRTVKASEIPDGATLLQTVQYQLAPTLDYQFLALPKGSEQWGIWEYSAFSLNAWWCLIAVALLLLRRLREFRPAASVRRPTATFWVIILGVVAAGFAFSVGDLVPVSAHRLLNYFLSGSIRVTGRYQLVFTVAWACIAALLLGRDRALRRLFFSYGAVAVPLLLSLNLFTFRRTFDSSSVAEILQADVDTVREMQLVSTVPSRTHNRHFMYPALLQGHAVLNCYDPIWRVGVMSREFQARPELMENGRIRVGVFPLIDLEAANPPETCVLESYFTQSEIELAASCPPGTCVNLNGMNEYSDSGLKFSDTVRKFCLP